MTAHRSILPQWRLLRNAAIRYVNVGKNGRALLLLHEMGGAIESWLPVIKLLPDTQRVICCDVRGAGGSEKIRSAVTCSDLVDDISELLTALVPGKTVDVAGVAMGGCLGLLLAARRPGIVNSVISINPPVQALGKVGTALTERAELAESSGMRRVSDAALARSYPDVFRGDEGPYQSYLAQFISNDPVSYAYIVRALANVDFREEIRSIAAPTLFVAGRHDLVRPSKDTAELVQLVSGSRFVEIEGGHIPSVQAPAAVAATLVGFLEGLPRR